MKVTILFDTERSYLSVAHLIRSPENPAGNVIRVVADTYDKLAQSVELMRRHKLPQWEKGPQMTDQDFEMLDIVALDTASRLADITRRDIVAPVGELTSLWGRRETLTPAPRDWGTMTDMLSRIFAPVAAFCEQERKRFLILTHESQRLDESTAAKKGGPDANAKLLSEIIENSDYVWRVWREETQQKIDNILYPKNTHYLRMTTSENKMTKMRLPMKFSRDLRDNLPNPTLQKVFDILGPFAPVVFTVFGPPGSGKTTFACTLSDPDAYETKPGK